MSSRSGEASVELSYIRIFYSAAGHIGESSPSSCEEGPSLLFPKDRDWGGVVGEGAANPLSTREPRDLFPLLRPNSAAHSGPTCTTRHQASVSEAIGRVEYDSECRAMKRTLAGFCNAPMV